MTISSMKLQFCNIYFMKILCAMIYRLTHSNQDRDFRYQFNSIGEEPEGITYWDLDENNKAPYIRGQLHAIMLDNAGKGDDDFYFKHYRRV